MHLAVRAWSAVGLGNTDLGLRILGFVLGLFLLLAFWFASWTMRGDAPLLAVTLAGLNVTMVRGGDSLRAYGLGSALGVLTLAVIWRLTCRPSLAAFSCAVAVPVLSVQSLYQNASRQPFQVVPIRIGCHNHKMVKIDLSRGVDKGQEVSLNMLKLRTFCSAPDLLRPRNTREMAIRPGTVIVR